MNYIDLFAGAGGLSEGFIRAGFSPIAHVELDQAACFTIKTRQAYYYLKEKHKLDIYAKYLKEEISRTELYSYVPDDILSSVINKAIGPDNKYIFNTIDKRLQNKKIDLIIGGPPCQAYSLIGRAAQKEKMVGDTRNYLYIQYAEFLKKYQPKFFVFENVMGLFSAKSESGERYLDKILKLFRKIGYETEYEVLNADDFGVLQKRKRVILIGKKGKETGFYPTFKKKNFDVTVAEIFKGLPQLKSGEGNYMVTPYTSDRSDYLLKMKILSNLNFTTQHIARPLNLQDKKIYKIAVQKWSKYQERLNYNDLPEDLKSHKNRNSFTDRFKVVASELTSSHTVVAHLSKDGHYYIHPDIKQNRSITPREAARLQSFPDDFFFEGVLEKPNRTAAFKQIGNAVPPLIAEEIAIKIKQLI